ncbi:MAG: multidrug effflux MFS transporter [Rhodospirillaceae bacterium]|jgi:MFS transporter, DHA1 family, multidrug resistance protein|nr:multidrug effflux MFS transporter [Rhodospirillaceae bacterium]MBT4939043.1 multidrug effflux MFS transporter [Rhodospirillaceae bacterium]MBT5938434.1 multidrug effflux MFS transporter [Rhodospirillaceae bacterium]MBT7268454.1 multidrug effflux MFS transporter [Rhodospirillaceae bacterium]
MPEKTTPTGRALLLLTLLLGCLNMFGPIGIDMFLAGVPNIAEGLGTTPNRVIASISTLLLGNALGQLILGPLSDRYGRKPIILLTLFVFAGSALAASLSPSIDYFIFWRFVQGLAISTGRILAASVARDLFEREKLGKMMADILFVTAIAAIIFPILGGQMAQHFNWRWLFWTMVAFGGLVFLLVVFFYQETISEKNPDAVRPSYLLLNWLETIRHPVFLRYVLCSSCVMSGFGAFLAISATVLRGAFGVSAEGYGFLFAIIAFFFMMSAFSGGRYILKIGQQRLISVGVIIALIGSSVLLIFALIDLGEPLAVVIPTAFYVFGLGWVFPQTNALALQPFPNSAGSAAALMGFITNITSAGMAFLLSTVTHTSALYLAIAIFSSAVLAFMVYFLVIRPTETRRG